MKPEEIALKLLDGLEPNLLDEAEVFYRCDCSRERTKGVLASIGDAELTKLAKEESEITVCCHFCKKQYVFSAQELLDLRKNA